MAVHGMLQIYSNDGSTSLYYNGEASPGDSYIVNETGLMDRGDAQVYTYTGNKKFIGFATTANATEPTYTIGDSTPSIVAVDLLTLYIVEQEPAADIPRIIYNGEVIAELSDKEVTITCVGKKMLSDIVIVNPVVEYTLEITLTSWVGFSYGIDKEEADNSYSDTVNPLILENIKEYVYIVNNDSSMSGIEIIASEDCTYEDLGNNYHTMKVYPTSKNAKITINTID